MTIADFPDRLKALLDAGETVYIYMSLTLYNQCEKDVNGIQKSLNIAYPGKLKIITTENVKEGMVMSTQPQLNLSQHGHEF